MREKIGIVTYFDAINPGAFLQAYCLKSFLESNFGFEVGFVKNKYINSLSKQRRVLFSSKNPITLTHNFSRYMSLRKAQKKHFNVSECPENYKLIVVGSDEMWNIKNSLFSSFNIDGGINDTPLASYAVSMGNFSDVLPLDMCKRLGGFNALSVRDTNSYEVLEKSLDKLISIHLDPVFLTDIPVQTSVRIKSDFLMVYGLINEKNIIEKIKELAKKRRLKIVSVDIFNRWCDYNVTSNSPFEFVGYIDAADIVITNMFHGTMLSVVRNKPFISLLTKRRRMKIEYAAKRLKFTNCCLDIEHIEYFENCSEILLDYKEINSIIAEERTKTKKYFSDILNAM